MGYTEAIAYGAATIINAIATGKDAAFTRAGGTGPAIVSVVLTEKVTAVLEVWAPLNGAQVRAKIDRQKAHILR